MMHVLQKLLAAHIRLTANRALNLLLKQKRSKIVSHYLLTPGNEVYMSRKSSRDDHHDEPVQWEIVQSMPKIK